MSAVDRITKGATVFIGAEAPLDRKVTWKVLSVHEDGAGTAYATIQSGLSGQIRTIPTGKLSIFRAVEAA